MGEPGFNVFWRVYPQKRNRERAHDAWFQLQLSGNMELEVIAALVCACLSGDEMFPQPATWLRDWARDQPRPATWTCPHMPRCPHRAACEVVAQRGRHGA